MKLKKRSILKYLIFGLFLFVLTYNNNYRIGPLKLFDLFRLFIYSIMSFYIVVNYSKLKRIISLILISGVIYSFLLLLNSNIFKSNSDFGFVLNSLSLPISLAFFYLYYKNNLNIIQKDIIFLSTFYLLSSVPFILGFLEQKEAADILWKYGLEDKTAFIGLFGSTANSSKVISLSLLVFLAAFLESKKNFVSKLLGIVIIVAGSYALVYSFARTAWVSFIFGIIFLLFTGKKRITAKVFSIFSIVVFSIVVLYFFSENEFLMRRLTGEKVYSESSNNSFTEIYAKARGGIQSASIEIFKSLNILEKIIGIGIEGLLTNMGRSYGSSIVPHNRFLMVLLVGGLKAFFMYLIFIKHLFKASNIKLNLKSIDHFDRLIPIMLFLFIIMQIPSHGFEFYSSILYGLVLAFALIKNDSYLYEKNTYCCS